VRAPLVLALALVLLPTSTAGADDAPSPLQASIICEAPPTPGRFRCDVEVRAPGGKLSWGDVVVTKVDDFILPLRGRLGPHDAATHDEDLYRWSLGFVAKTRGVGDVTIRVRAVVCRGTECNPVETQVLGRVAVGR
jgi:hypothetical protein